jgi:hypothetical protein
VVLGFAVVRCELVGVFGNDVDVNPSFISEPETHAQEAHFFDER